MYKRHDVHIVSAQSRDGWVVAQGGRIVSRHSTQGTAIAAGQRRARRDQVDLVTHGRDGRIRSKDSYGNESAVRDTEH